ncbi:serine/threonine-protein kinase [Kitasatospora purpeofusca]|uniref:serine/threonine-protein kinase n=1 Tax=Kitasatospora purpeofusca TaxID=67352 RepID=UPI00224C8236|nr:serine/threonine-protein kinase [Kitasatospora purpeofusca]MCX4752060.1 serine/threonine protein kinase [Kitasatospora purpeofusca]WSR31663.1 serine/threonine protein kinase [Kitasatospora purpeofusca]WSR39689.1 serine/threonine protein kinase [Kitasatospora purpeofusca]
MGPFRVLAVLGQGGMGRVLLGVAPDGRPAAVKQVHAEFAGDDGFRVRFRREVEASRRVSGAYTAAVIAADPEAETPWLASQFVLGPALNEALRAVGALPEESARRLAAGLAQALIDVHGAGLIHRDLKPSNVLLAEDGVRVIDFGIARAAEGQDTKLTRTGAMIGSPGFMSPEQVEGRELTPASDVFSLGATLAVACAGRPAFAGESLPRVLFAVLHAEPELSGVPVGLRPLVAACLAKDPAARPTPHAVLAALGRITPAARPWPEAVHGLLAVQRAEVARLMGGGAPSVVASVPTRTAPQPAPVLPPPTVPQPAPVRRRRRGRRIALAVGATVLALAGVAGGLVATGVVDLESLRPEAVPTPGNVPLAQVKDKYAPAVPTCVDARRVTAPPEFSLPWGNPGTWEYTDTYGKAPEKSCEWNTRSGDQISIVWDVFPNVPGGVSGAVRAKEHYEGLYIGGHTRVADPGYAEEAFWLPAKSLHEDNCVLYVRDVNLYVFLAVRGAAYPKGQCEETTRTLAVSAVELAKYVTANGASPDMSATTPAFK